jgi:ferrous iron transport protein B
VKIALAGQPNCGKSTIFNAVVGYRSLTSNFSGTTVEYQRAQASINGNVIDLYDLPGVYSLIPANAVEASTRDSLLEHWDVLINVVDASQLSRSLELTLELREIGCPIMVCLNMMDEPRRKGMVIDTGGLADALGVPVVEAIASRGRGVVEAIRAAIHLGKKPGTASARSSIYPREVEKLIGVLAERVGWARPSEADRPRSKDCNESRVGVLAPAAETWTVPYGAHRMQALLLLQGDPKQLAELDSQTAEMVCDSLAALRRTEEQAPEDVIAVVRHAACLRIFEQTVRIVRPHADWRERVDALVMHKLWGYVFLAAAFFGFFHLIFDAGSLAETRILALFDRLITLSTARLAPQGLALVVTKGALLGAAGAVGTVLPYLIPFLIGLAVMEDLGYLARVGYLMDSAMHRLGLHGTATLPVLLGYGCTVPAVMATRILHSRRDRFVASFLAVLVPCSARMTVIMALVGLYLGANWALAIYGIDFAVVALAGVILARVWPEISPGMLMEVPPLRRPGIRVVLLKTWWRLREFVVLATPLLIVGSTVLSAIDYAGMEHSLDSALSPITTLLGLPAATGLTLIFGVMRKEMSLLMLMQSLGTSDVGAVMSPGQIVVFTLFVTFYLPCLATVAMMLKEAGWKLTAIASGALLSLALAISVAARVTLHFVM